MTFERFKFIIHCGEKATVDFKLRCNAFKKSAGDQEKARAELIKDICAMANNGPVSSFLVIGVGDDRKTFESVNDENLTDENLQTLIRDAISPRPKVRLLKLTWKNAPARFREKDFVVIQVGPNPRLAFRLAQDRVNWEKRYYFRKNEVWVRNGSTSDLATPEQIYSLLSRRRPTGIEVPDLVNNDYEKLARSEQLNMLKNETATLLQQLGGKVIKVDTKGRSYIDGVLDFRVVLELRSKVFIFRCSFAASTSEYLNQRSVMRNQWQFEHGFLFFVIGTAAKAHKYHQLEIDAPERWGQFSILKFPSYLSSENGHGFPQTLVPFLIFSRVKDTQTLRDRLTQALEGLVNEDVLFRHLNQCREELNHSLRRWAALPISKKEPRPLFRDLKEFDKQVGKILTLLRLSK